VAAPIGFPEHSIALVLGTRPEIIKLATIAELLGPARFIIHTGQHYDYTLASSFFSELSLEPDLILDVGALPRGQQIGAALRLLDEHFALARPLAVVVQGDSNATLAGALAANARDIPLVHVEAGLRSYDRRMPEEHNRVATDHFADLCCAPTTISKNNLAAEGIIGPRVEITGNTIVEAVTRLILPARRRTSLLDRLGIVENQFILATFHRPENVDERSRLATILTELNSLPYPVVLPMHPRTARQISTFELDAEVGRIRVIEPSNHQDFLGLVSASALIVSDSGGIQEEASILKKPVIVVRNSTERPEVLGTFCKLVAPGPEISETARMWAANIESRHSWLRGLPSPFGDGTASLNCLRSLERLLFHLPPPDQDGLQERKRPIS
jgi:UDP-N-acetylglucosamine 2-epimerase (non-hydrolysing)